MSTVEMAPGVTRAHDQWRITFGGVVRGELIKLLTLRSIIVVLAITGIIIVGLPALLVGVVPVDFLRDSPTAATVFLTVPSVLIPAFVTALGVVAMTGEYASRQIVSTLTVVPRRVSLLLAKGSALGITVCVVSLVSTALSTLLLVLIVSARVGRAAQFPAESVQIVIVTSLSFALFALIGLAVGVLVRSAAGGVAVALGITFLLPVATSTISALLQAPAWLVNIASFLPSSLLSIAQTIAGTRGVSLGVTAGSQQGELGLSWWLAFMLLGVWAIGSLALASWVLAKRDA